MENCGCGYAGRNTAIAVFDAIHVSDGQTHDEEIKVFHEELLQLAGKPDFDNIADADTLENLFEGLLPISLTFLRSRHYDGAWKMSEPQNIERNMELPDIDDFE